MGQFAAALHTGLQRRGVDSVVVTRGAGDGDEGVERIAASRLGWFFATLGWTRRAAAADVVHCHSGEALPVLLALRLWPRRRARTLVTFHVGSRGMRAAERPYHLEGRRFGVPAWRRPLASLLGWLHGGVDALALRLADAINTISRATSLDLLGPDRAASVRIIYNGVPRPGPPDDDEAAPIELFYAGVGSHRKRVLTLPFVLEHVRRALPGARLRIAGFHPRDAPELHELFAELGLAREVDWLGPVPATALSRLYRAARVVVVPSAYEGLPYVVLEALAHGVPVVATRVSGHPEAIEDGVNGQLVPVDAPAELAERCVEILSDPALAQRLGAAGRETVELRFRLEDQLDSYLEYYRSLVEETT